MHLHSLYWKGFTKEQSLHAAQRAFNRHSLSHSKYYYHVADVSKMFEVPWFAKVHFDLTRQHLQLSKLHKAFNLSKRAKHLTLKARLR